MAYRLQPILNAEQTEPIRFEIDQVEVLPGELEFDNGHVSYEDLENKQPYLAGSFTGWRYRKMKLLHEYTAAMTKRPRDFLEVAQDMRKVRRKCATLDDCSKVEKRWVEICRLSEQLRYTYQWPHYFKQGIKYKLPFIINGHLFREPFDQLGQVDENGKVITEDSLIPPELRTTIKFNQELDTSDSDSELEEIRRKTQTPLSVVIEKKKPKKTSSDDEEEVKKEVLPDLPDVEKFDKVWVLPFFAKPGTQQYMIKFKDINDVAQKKSLRKIRKHERRLNDVASRKRKFNEDLINRKLKEEKAKLGADCFFYECTVPERSEEIPACKFERNCLYVV